MIILWDVISQDADTTAIQSGDLPCMGSRSGVIPLSYARTPAIVPAMFIRRVTMLATQPVIPHATRPVIQPATQPVIQPALAEERTSGQIPKSA